MFNRDFCKKQTEGSKSIQARNFTIIDICVNLIFMFPCIATQYTKMTNKMQLCVIIYYSLAALHVSSDIFAHHQEHLNCIGASGITHVCRCRLVSRDNIFCNNVRIIYFVHYILYKNNIFYILLYILYTIDFVIIYENDQQDATV